MTERYIEYFDGADDAFPRILAKIKDYAGKKPDGAVKVHLTVEGGKIKCMEVQADGRNIS